MFKSYIKRKVREEVAEALRGLRAEIAVEQKETIGDFCFQFILEIFSDEKDSESMGGYPYRYEVKTIGGKFKERAIAAVSKETATECRVAAKSIISGEEFLDSIVERIKKKQITK